MELGGRPSEKEFRCPGVALVPEMSRSRGLAGDGSRRETGVVVEVHVRL